MRSRDAAWVLLVIAAGTALRLGLAVALPLNVDEAYAAVMGRRLSLSYFDHPPMAFWWVGLATRLMHSESPLVVRLPFILAFMATTWLLYLLGSFLFGRRAGLLSAILLNVSLFFSMSAGGWALPDGPLLLFSAASAYCLARATLADDRTPLAEASLVAGPGRWAWWIGFGVGAGLALLSKYHAVLILAGAAAYLLTSSRRAAWLRRAEPWIATACSAVLFLPVVLWNAQHQWASFRFQAGRAVPVGETGGTPLFDSLAGQAAWTLPWIWIPLLLALLSALRAGPRDARRWLLVCLGSGPVLGFTLLAAGGIHGLPHWGAPGYFMLLPLLGAAVVGGSSEARPWVARWLGISCVSFCVVVLGLAAHARTGWLRSAAPRLFSKGDPALDFLDWTPVAQRLRTTGLPRPGVLIAAARWEDAAKMALAMGPAVEVGCVGEDARGFAILTEPASNLGRDVLLVVRRRPGPEPLVGYAGYFDSLRGREGIPIERGGREGLTISVYEGQGLRRLLPRLRR